MSDSAKKQRLEDLIRQVLAPADKAAHAKAVHDLARTAAATRKVAPVFELLLNSPVVGPLNALELVARLPEPLPAEVLKGAVPLLELKDAPTPSKLSVAAKILNAVPNNHKAASLVIRSLTAGLPRTRVLERMYQLQSRIENSDALDVLIATTEARSKLTCPKCPAKLTRTALVSHLWTVHRMTFDHGKARDPRLELDAQVTAAAESNDPLAIDETYLLSSHFYPTVPPRLVFQALTARGSGDPTQSDKLLARADADRSGLCPVCLSSVPDPIPALPPAANASGGRLAADGYSVDVVDSPRGRIVTIGSPGGSPRSATDPGRRIPPRLFAVFATLPVFTFSAVVALTFPPRFASPFFVASGMVLIGWIAYGVARFIRKPLINPTTRAIELAWDDLVPGIGRSANAIRFLTRLCRASIGVGSAVDRATTLFELIEHATVLADKGPTQQQLLASARVLQVFDGARLGREKIAGLVSAFEPFFKGTVPPAYAEAAAELVLTADNLLPGEIQRLAVLLIGSAYDGGLQPADLTTISRFCPSVRRILFDGRPDHLGLLYAVWKGRNIHPWATVGAATTVFALARESPASARKALAETNDLLLRVELEQSQESAVGSVLITGKGVAVDGYRASDPNARVELVRGASGGWELWYGPHKINLPRKVSDRFLDSISGWLKYRATKLVPAADQGSRGPGPLTSAMLIPLAMSCPLCGTESLIRSGRVGTPWMALSGRQ